MTGVLARYKDTLHILPRSQEDISPPPGVLPTTGGKLSDKASFNAYFQRSILVIIARAIQLLGIDHGQGCDIDDVSHLGSCGNDLNRLGHTH